MIAHRYIPLLIIEHSIKVTLIMFAESLVTGYQAWNLSHLHYCPRSVDDLGRPNIPTFMHLFCGVVVSAPCLGFIHSCIP
jgi:hypothetical protein